MYNVYAEAANGGGGMGHVPPGKLGEVLLPGKQGGCLPPGKINTQLVIKIIVHGDKHEF